MNALLSVRGLEASQGTQRVLRGVDVELAAGEICAVMGVSGAGKSTVLRAIAALQPFSGGSIVVDGVALLAGPLPPESRLKELRRKVGVVFQSHALFEHLTVLENVTLALIHALKWTPDQANGMAFQLLGELGVDGRSATYPRALSGGEAQRVAIARALAPDPRLLLMDEPTSALDPARRVALCASLRSLAAQGRGILIVTHDAEFARACADRVVTLKDGAID